MFLISLPRLLRLQRTGLVQVHDRRVSAAPIVDRPPVLVVVAAGPGLGLAVARRFAREGWSVGLVARSADTLAELARALATNHEDVRRTAPGRVSTAVADVADESALRAALRSLASDLGDPVAVVFNGSAFVTGSVLGLSTADLRTALDVGVAGALVTAQEVAPAMRARGGGTLLFTGSVAADRASTSAAAVGVAKAGLRSLARSLHKELAPAGVRVVSVTVDGVLQGPNALDLDLLAQRYWELATGAETPGAVETFPG